MTCLTIQEHNKKTHIENPQILTSLLDSLQKKVTRINITTGKIANFVSRIEAAKSVIGHASDVGKAIKHNKSYRGYWWFDKDDPDLPNESWRHMCSSSGIVKIRVSNLGRIWSTGQRKTYGWKDNEKYRFRYNGRIFGIHEIVCKAFYGPPPSPTHTVDHIDRDPYNNKAENLRWATKQEQATNRESVRAVEAYVLESNEAIGRWPTLVAAAAATGAAYSNIGKVIKEQAKSCGKTAKREKIAWRFAETE